MLGFLRALFYSGPERPTHTHVMPAGIRDVAEFAWEEPGEQGMPTAKDLKRLRAAFDKRGWDFGADHRGHAVELALGRNNAIFMVSIGHNGEGPWVVFVDVLADEDVPEAAAFAQVVHEVLVEVGATNLRWYDRQEHDRGVVGEPWSTPSGKPSS